MKIKRNKMKKMNEYNISNLGFQNVKRRRRRRVNIE